MTEDRSGAWSRSGTTDVVTGPRRFLRWPRSSARGWSCRRRYRADRRERLGEVDHRRDGGDGVRALLRRRLAWRNALHPAERVGPVAGDPARALARRIAVGFLPACRDHARLLHLSRGSSRRDPPPAPRAEPRRVLPRRTCAPDSTPRGWTASTSPRPRSPSPRRSRWSVPCPGRASSRPASGGCGRRRTTISSSSRTGSAPSTSRCATCGTSSSHRPATAQDGRSRR
jgi:hypothetical protein